MKTLRSWRVMLLPALAVSCVSDRPEATPSGPEAEHPPVADWTVFAAGHPNILVASPEATNYAPPGWPLEPGDVVASNEWGREDGLGKEGAPSWEQLHWQWGGWSGLAVVWVIGDSGPAGAKPFGAKFGYHDDGTTTYYGHAPVTFGYDPLSLSSWKRESIEEEIPPPLRGLVNIDDHGEKETVETRRALFEELGIAEVTRRGRDPYYGKGASW